MDKPIIEVIMKEFKIGQHVKIVHESILKRWNIPTSEIFVGAEFLVSKTSKFGSCAYFGGWWIPSEACELVAGAAILKGE